MLWSKGLQSSTCSLQVQMPGEFCADCPPMGHPLLLWWMPLQPLSNGMMCMGQCEVQLSVLEHLLIAPDHPVIVPDRHVHQRFCVRLSVRNAFQPDNQWITGSLFWLVCFVMCVARAMCVCKALRMFCVFSLTPSLSSVEHVTTRFSCPMSVFLLHSSSCC